MKFWKLQTRVVERLCTEMGIEIMMPPAIARDNEGFLARDYYSNDATHANHRYGEQVLRQIQNRFLGRRAKSRAVA